MTDPLAKPHPPSPVSPSPSIPSAAPASPVKQHKVRTHGRYWEIDAARGICLIGMVIFHTIFLMGIFHIISADFWEQFICMDLVFPGSNFQLIHLGTSIFVLICGFSLVLRQRRMEGMSKKAYNIAVVRRALQVFLFGVLFAVVGSILIYFFIGDGIYMIFDFLMMMGVSMVLALPFVRMGKWACIPAVIFIVLGFVLSTIQGPLYLMPLGILPGDYLPRDFFPIFPWMGIMLLGFAIGSVLYPKGERRFKVPDPNTFFRVLAKIGTYPLRIYVLHIPVIAIILFLICAVAELFGCHIGGLF